MPTPKKASDAEVKAVVRALVDRDLYRTLLSICRAHHVDLDDVIRKTGSRQVVRARDACFARLADMGLSSTETGRLMGYEHSSVLCAVQRHRERKTA